MHNIIWNDQDKKNIPYTFLQKLLCPLFSAYIANIGSGYWNSET